MPLNSKNSIVLIGLVMSAAVLVMVSGILLLLPGPSDVNSRITSAEDSQTSQPDGSSADSGSSGQSILDSDDSGDSAGSSSADDSVTTSSSGGSSAQSSSSGSVNVAAVRAFNLGSYFNDRSMASSAQAASPYKAAPSYPAEITATDSHVELRSGNQKISFDKNSSGEFVLTTYVYKNSKWVEFFNAGLPIVQGNSFGMNPTNYEVIGNSATRKAILMSGENIARSYTFEYLVEVDTSSPLIHFQLTYYLNNRLVMSGTEPRIMLWRDSADSGRLTLNQEVPSYQSLDDTVKWKRGCPSTYFYTDGMESAIYFNMTPMTWYSFGNGVRRFKVSQARTVVSSGQTGSGLDLRSSTNGAVIGSGDMVVDFYLYGNSVSSKPTKLKALNTIVEAFGTTLPSTTKWPSNYLDGSKTFYEDYAAEITRGLMVENITYRYQPVKTVNDGAKIWKDTPLFAERTISTMLQRPGYALKSTSGGAAIYGDWNCNNNTLIPWLIYNRLHPDAMQKAFLDKGLESMLTYYDKKAQLIRSFEEQPGYTGNGLEFTFQNYFMNQGTLWASYFRNPEDFDPAMGGKFIQSTEGMIKLAKNCNYVFPQLFSASTLSPTGSIDETSLGTVYEAWSGGMYSYNMCLAYDLTKDKKYLNEATVSLDKLFTDMSYYANDLRQKLYTDPYDFPINEVSSAPWGVAAANLLYYYTGEAKWLNYADDIQNTTLRMMNWYESALRDDLIDKSVASLALFHAFSATDTTCTWENIMTYLPMILMFKNPAVAPDPTMLKLYNLYRINGFNFCGPSWNPDTVPTARTYTASPAGWLAVEDYYSAETPTPMGANGPNTYMSNGPLFNFVLFEAYAKAANRDVCVMNLDCVDAGKKMAEGIERNFILYNGAAASIKTPVRFYDLSSKLHYQVTTVSSKGKTAVKTYTGSALMNGLDYTLQSRDYLRVSIICLDKAATQNFIAMQKAQNALMIYYASIQSSAQSGITPELQIKKETYIEALNKYRQKQYDESYSLVK
ncbi:MAG: hypothetical protein ACYC5K_01725 [Saccharofermentanales bacterium]